MEENINVIEMDEEVGMTEVEENSGNSLVGAIVKGLCVLGLAAGGTALYLRKTKEKRKAKKINKATEMLRAEGFEICKPAIELKEYVEVDPDDIQD